MSDLRIITKSNMMYYPLSGLQMHLLNPKSKIIKYDELNNVNDINKLFASTDSIIILYLIFDKFSGHWCTLFKNKQGFNYFDSYGGDIDAVLDSLTPSQRKDLKEKEDKLKKLLDNYNVIYNNVKFQGKNTETCGQHCTFRLHNKKMTAQQYVDYFLDNNITDPDYYVADYVFNLIIKNKILEI